MFLYICYVAKNPPKITAMLHWEVYGIQHSPECAAVAASMNGQVLQPGVRTVVQGTHDILNWLRSLGRFVSTMLIYLVRAYMGCSCAV